MIRNIQEYWAKQKKPRLKDVADAFGCGFSEGYGNDFDITKLRYDKIIIMADADVDGAHISTLLLTLFYRFMPELIFEGHVYVAMPPLYKVIPSKGEEEYLYDDAALERYRKTHTGNFTLQRYKGLGEMDAEQLWETTLNPKTRMMKRIEIEDGRLASDVTAMLMGTDVPPRKAFIYDHASKDEYISIAGSKPLSIRFASPLHKAQTQYFLKVFFKYKCSHKKISFNTTSLCSLY